MVYCGGPAETCDHVPSRVLLDEPLPDNLSVVDCCLLCNTGFSLDEQYFACFVDCVINGAALPTDATRSRVARILSETPSLITRIAASESLDGNGQRSWLPETARVNNVMLKLARGHVAFELSLLQLDEPQSVTCAPLIRFIDDCVQQFLSSQKTSLWPENGSRAFIRAYQEFPTRNKDHWHVIQDGRYQYLVSQADGLLVRILLSNYLACEVRWK